MATRAGGEIVGAGGAAFYRGSKAHLRAGLLITGTPPATTPPTIGSPTPATPGPIGAAQAIALTITDTLGLRRVFVTATFPSGLVENVYDGDGFAGGYDAGSSATPTSTSLALTIARDAGWLESGVTLKVMAVNKGGVDATPSTFTYSVAAASSTPAPAPVSTGGGIGFLVD